MTLSQSVGHQSEAQLTSPLAQSTTSKNRTIRWSLFASDRPTALRLFSRENNRMSPQLIAVEDERAAESHVEIRPKSSITMLTSSIAALDMCREHVPLKVVLDNAEASSRPEKKTTVGFSSQVEVVPIPSYADYDQVVRQRLWSNRLERTRMAERNLLEFAAEGWDWRNVVEDGDMIRLGDQIIHPVHSKPLLASALRRQLPYPIAAKSFDLLDHDADPFEPCFGEEGAVCRLEAPIERPSCCPFSDDEDEQDDWEPETFSFPCSNRSRRLDATAYILSRTASR